MHMFTRIFKRKNLGHPKLPTIENCLNKSWYIYRMEYYVTMKNHDVKEELISWENFHNLLSFKGGTQNHA